jgi:hypothetical protein
MERFGSGGQNMLAYVLADLFFGSFTTQFLLQKLHSVK